MSVEVFLCPKNQLTPKTRADLRKAGVLVVEVDNPSDCQFIRASESFSADDMLWATLKALTHSSLTGAIQQRDHFVTLLAGLADKSRTQLEPET